MQAVLFPAPSWQVRLGGKAITKQGSSIYTAWGVLSCTKSHPPPPRQQHKYSLLPPLKLTSFFIMHLFLFFSSIFPSALLGSPIHKGGWRGERETERNGRKRASGEGGIGAVMESNHINSEIFTSGLENAMVQLWQTNRPPPFPQHTHRHTHTHTHTHTGNTVDSKYVYPGKYIDFFIWGKKTKKKTQKTKMWVGDEGGGAEIT